MSTSNWRSEIADLKARAHEVTATDLGTQPCLSARTVARLLSGIVHVVAGRYGMDVAQRACADLVRCEAAWTSRFGTLPVVDGVVPDPISILATASRGLMTIAGACRLRSAMAFWASESDPYVWQGVTGGAAAS